LKRTPMMMATAKKAQICWFSVKEDFLFDYLHVGGDAGRLRDYADFFVVVVRPVIARVAGGYATIGYPLALEPGIEGDLGTAMGTEESGVVGLVGLDVGTAPTFSTEGFGKIFARGDVADEEEFH